MVPGDPDANRLETKYDFKLWLKYDTTKEPTYWDASVVPLLGPAQKVTGIAIFCLDITKRHQALETIKRKQTELEVLGKKFEDSKAGIRVLLDMEEQTRKRSEEKLSLNVNNLVLPLVARIKSSRLNKEQRALLDLIESTLTDITSGFSHDLSSPLWD